METSPEIISRLLTEGAGGYLDRASNTLSPNASVTVVEALRGGRRAVEGAGASEELPSGFVGSPPWHK